VRRQWRVLSAVLYIWWCRRTWQWKKIFLQRNRNHNKRYEDRAWPEAYPRQMQLMNGWWRKQRRTNKCKIGCMNKHRLILSILSDCRSSLRHINANQHLSTGLLQRSQLLEFTEIILKYSSMMQHYNPVCFDRAIQRILSLYIYIYYELLVKPINSHCHHMVACHHNSPLEISLASAFHDKMC